MTQLVEEDISVLGGEHDGLVGVVGGSVDTGGESLVLDRDTEPFGDLHEWRRGLGLVDGQIPAPSVSSNLKTGMDLKPTRMSENSSPGSPCSSEAFSLSSS